MARAASATQQNVSANVSAAASLGLLEGRTLSMNRAAANFTTRILGLGPLLQQAFPVIGAIAFLDVLYQMGNGLYKTIEAARGVARAIGESFDSVIVSVRRGNDELALTNDKLDATIAKLEHKPTTNGSAIAIDEIRVAADRLDESLDHVTKSLDGILKRNGLSLWGSILTMQAPTGETAKYVQQQFDRITQAQENARDKIDAASQLKDPNQSASALKEAYENERALLEVAANNLRDKYNVLQQLQSAHDVNGLTGDQTANLTLTGKAAHLALEEVRELDLTMANIGKEQTVAKLRDDTSALRDATRQAAIEWKQLESEFVRFQTEMDRAGHKPTAQEDLSFLVGKESTINPLNQDRLQAKELPYRNQITSQQQFNSETTARLKDQVAAIGLYNDGLKEAGELDRILEQARRRNITLTAQEIDTYKSLIATIVESRAYDQQLETIYKSVSDVTTQFEARISAINALFNQGVLSQDQYNQGISETVRQYGEASNAVTTFQREMSDMQRDQEARKGTQSHIAAISQLQGLDNQLRYQGDASHPFGYNESEIDKANAALLPLIESQQRKNAIDQESNSLLTQQSNLLEQISIREAARTNALNAGAISQGAANSGRLKDRSALNDQQLSSGIGGDPIKGAIEDYAKNFTTLGKGIEDTFKPVFKTLGDGFADSLGRAVAYGKNLGDALKDVARGAIAELISGLTKLGIQQIINLTMGQAAATAATAATVAQAQIVSTAWAPAAFAASVATLGSADVIGGTAYAAGLATAIGLSAAVPKLATGTNSVPSDMLAYIHEDERVVPAADNRAMIAALQGSGKSQNAPIHVEINNNNGSQVQVQQVSENRVRVMIEQSVPSLIEQHAPRTIARNIANPNSTVSKAITRNTNSTRQR
ncbi:MAG TPA: hypothetical protein VHZ28_13565 [Terracidiphilus sp.]|nr:hypothetical protein [Terracidiphilus sp.]